MNNARYKKKESLTLQFSLPQRPLDKTENHRLRLIRRDPQRLQMKKTPPEVHGFMKEHECLNRIGILLGKRELKVNIG